MTHDGPDDHRSNFGVIGGSRGSLGDTMATYRDHWIHSEVITDFYLFFHGAVKLNTFTVVPMHISQVCQKYVPMAAVLVGMMH